MTTSVAPLTSAEYKRLLRDMRSLWKEEKARAERTFTQALLRAYHRIGKRILAEKLSTRAGYGDAVIRQLALDLKIDARTLRYAVAFAREYGRVPKNKGLSWTHYRELLRLPSAEQRSWYETRAVEQRWSKRKLAEAISQGEYVAQLPARKASIGKGKPRIAKLTRPTEASFVYRAEVVRVVDADTLVVKLDLGFRVFTEQRLRLAAIDAPELRSKPGEEAFVFVRDRLATVDYVVIKTNKVDLYGRYVAHLFYAPGEKNRDRVFASGRYLNQELIDQGLAKSL